MDTLITKAKPWAYIIEDLKENEEANFSVRHERTIRARISGKTKNLYPERSYKTKVSGEVITVTRLADKPVQKL